MHAPILLARSNAVHADAVVRVLGFDRSAEAEMRANLAGEQAPYEFAHVVLDLRLSVPRAMLETPGLRVARHEATTTVGGTLAAWWTALEHPELPPRLRNAFAARLSAHSTLAPFGPARFLGEPPASIAYAPTVRPDAPAAACWGGIVACVLDRQAEADLTAAGARILKRLAPGAAFDPQWTELAQPLPASGRGDARKPARKGEAADDATVAAAPFTSTGLLTWPVPTDVIGPKHLTVLEALDRAYVAALAGLADREDLVAVATRHPLIAGPAILAVDLHALRACAAATHPMTRYVASTLATQIEAAGRLREIAPPNAEPLPSDPKGEAPTSDAGKTKKAGATKGAGGTTAGIAVAETADAADAPDAAEVALAGAAG